MCRIRLGVRCPRIDPKETTMQKLALYLALGVLAAACASKDAKQDVPVADKSSTATPTPSASGSTTSPARPVAAIDPLKDPNNPLSKHSVYFDFDSNAVKDEYRGVVTAHSRYL